MILGLIDKYENTRAILKSIYNNKSKLKAIINFFRECEKANHFPPDFCFIEEFIPIIINIFKSTSINFIDPEYLKSAKLILNLSKKYYSEELILNQINTTLEFINIQLLKLYFYLGEYEEGLIILKDIIETGKKSVSEQEYNIVKQRDKDKRAKKEIARNKSIVTYDTFKKSRAFEILDEIRYELDRLNSFSYSEINAVLVEDDYTDSMPGTGIIEPLFCEITGLKKSTYGDNNVRFENITDLSDNELQDNLTNLKRAIQLLLNSNHTFTTLDKLSFAFSFPNHANIYRGSSFMLPAGILAFCGYYNFFNSRSRYLINSTAAFSASLDRDGNLIKLPSEVLRTKINAAFYSWIKYLVIPKDNFEEAVEITTKLNKKHPKKNFNTIAISNIAEILDNQDIMRKETDTIINHTKNKIIRHPIISSIIFSFFALLLGLLAAFKLLPKDIKPLPLPESDMYIIYAPDRDTNWIFHNNNLDGGDTIDFGDVAIGDQWFPKIQLINNSRGSERFSIYTEGKDRDEFQITRYISDLQMYNTEYINSDNSQTIYIKFVPYKTEGIKTADLIFSSESGTTKRIKLKGNAGRYGNGYSIKLEDDDDDVVMDFQTNVLNNNFVISFWIKPIEIKATPFSGYKILKDDNNPLTNNKFNIFLNPDSTIQIVIAGNKTNIIVTKGYDIKPKIDFGKWNYIALGYNGSKLYCILNDKINFFETEKDIFKGINDCIYFNDVHPSETISEPRLKRTVTFYLDEFTIFSKYIEPEVLLTNKYKRLKGLEEGLAAYYDFDFCTPKKVFDLTKNDYWPKLSGGIKRVLDSPPLEPNKKNNFKKEKNIVFKRHHNGILKFYRNILSDSNSYTIQCDCRYDKTNEFYHGCNPFYISRGNLDITITLEGNKIHIGLINQFKTYYNTKHIDIKDINKWQRITLCYIKDKHLMNVYYDGKEIFSESTKEIIPEFSANFMGIAFGAYHYFADPRRIFNPTYIDNIKIYNRAISPEEIFSDSKNGLLAYWTFQNTDNELAYDEINNYPLIMLEDFELINEDIENP